MKVRSNVISRYIVSCTSRLRNQLIGVLGHHYGAHSVLSARLSKSRSCGVDFMVGAVRRQFT